MCWGGYCDKLHKTTWSMYYILDNPISLTSSTSSLVSLLVMDLLEKISPKTQYVVEKKVESTFFKGYKYFCRNLVKQSKSNQLPKFLVKIKILKEDYHLMMNKRMDNQNSMSCP